MLRSARHLPVALFLALFLASSAAPAVPVGYDHPQSDQGGPTVAGGLGWIAEVWPHTLILADKPVGGKPTVMFITNFSAPPALHELNRRFPMDALLVAPPSTNEFPGREAFLRALRSRRRVDCFVFSRVKESSIPADVQYEILRRVKDDGAGIVVIDLFDRSPTFNPQFLGLKPTASGAELIPGIPYDGLRQYANTKEDRYTALNYWNTSGVLASAPQAQPFRYASVEVSPFGQGKVVWVSTGTHWERYHGGRTLLPHLQQRRDMWVETDYLYSHTAKLIRLACGRAPAVEVRGLSPHGTLAAVATDPPQHPAVTLACPGGKAFAGTLKFQLRDTWGEITQHGTQPLTVPEAGGDFELNGLQFADAGRQFVDVWVLNGAGETVDWGSGFVNVERGVAPPEIVNKHPAGAPRAAALEGEIRLTNAPTGATLRATLVDRYWREVGLLRKPAAATVPFSFPSVGLDGQIWLLKADVLDRDGHVLARAFANLTSPHTRATRGGFHPLMTATGGFGTPESVAREEFLRRLGFLSDRPYGAGSPLAAEMNAWADVQMMPFAFNITGASDDFKNEHITDWEDPAVKQDYVAAYEFLTKELAPFGLRGFNQTDDSSPCSALPLGAYTTIKFHEWLRREYGDFAAVCRAWNWQPATDDTPAGQLPPDPYVTVAFHQWLRQKYGGLAETAKAWKLKADGWGSMHTFGAIQYVLVRQEHETGNDVPWNDAAEFMKQVQAERNPFGRIHQAAIKAQHDAGNTAPSMDAQRFMQRLWVEHMMWGKTAVTALQPDAAVGTDAAYYGAAMSDAFGKLDYLAPYYTDRAVKVAVSRGRMRRPGDFGACLGSYGEKATSQAGRRAQIWDVLFAGGNGLYYWYFGDGLSQDLRLSDKHAVYQCEAIEEIMGGIGELFTGCQRLFHPVALLDSQTSALCDQLDAKGEPLTNQGRSLGAFQYALEDLGLNPDTITAEELSGGWPAQHGTKLLVLPGANSMSDAEIAAVRDFVSKGGTVVADIRPGARLPNGNPREANPLDAVFGISFDASGKAARVKGPLTGKATPGGADLNFGEALADPRVKATTATALGAVAGAPAILINTTGSGRAVLLNASFSSYATYRTEGGAIWQPWHEVMKAIASQAGLKPEFAVTSGGQETPGFEVSPFRNGRGYLLGVEDLGTGDFVGARRPVEVRGPRVFHIYDMRAGKYLGRAATVKTDLPRQGHRAYALTPYQVQAVTATVDRPTVQPGDTLKLTADVVITPAGARDLHVVRVEATTPEGKGFFPFRRVLKMPPSGPLVIPLTTARNDPPGAWQLSVTDVNTGTVGTAKFTLAKGAER